MTQVRWHAIVQAGHRSQRCERRGASFVLLPPLLAPPDHIHNIGRGLTDSSRSRQSSACEAPRGTFAWWIGVAGLQLQLRKGSLYHAQ
ncbi:hypothetical protein HYQ45_015296 [Verticillium longisporum]|uniref:Uncharacterized protein n=1 Tax=Verticillium longisporum TaxID=100787 RepID=A0A8I2Z851_VERLO|nr:hypothetical protein HYQ45_015296 [Verticillium longisporum]